MRKEVFTSGWSLRQVTSTPVSFTETVAGKCLKIIDTAGLLNPHSLESVEDFEQLARAIVDMPNGISAVGIVISLSGRINEEVLILLKNLLTMKEIIPYSFLIFTHARLLGKTGEAERRKSFEIMISDEASCPKVLQQVMINTNYRYLLLEITESMDSQYQFNKSEELVKILQGIMDQNGKMFTSSVSDIAKHFQSLEGRNKEDLIKAIVKDLQAVNAQLKDNKNTTNEYWSQFFCYVAGGLGISTGAALNFPFSSSFAATASQIVTYLTNDSEILTSFIGAVSKYLS